MIALEQDAFAVDLVRRARAFLKQLQRADGGWGIAAPDDESGWMTAWAVWALAQSDDDVAQRGVQWLLNHSGLRVTDPKEIERVKQVLKIDATITGWPWLPGDAAWIFPTALALLALNAMRIHEHPREQEAIQYLLDRAIPTGGWNIGNPFMVTGDLPPTVENTALALLALDAYAIENEITRRARAWLAQENFTPTAFEWAWRAWYWTRSKSQVSDLKASEEYANRALVALKELQRADGSFDGNPFTTAIAAMTLDV